VNVNISVQRWTPDLSDRPHTPPPTLPSLLCMFPAGSRSVGRTCGPAGSSGRLRLRRTATTCRCSYSRSVRVWRTYAEDRGAAGTSHRLDSSFLLAVDREDTEATDLFLKSTDQTQNQNQNQLYWPCMCSHTWNLTLVTRRLPSYNVIYK